VVEDYPTFYEVLQVSESARPAEIKAAYRRLIKQYHPDKIPPDLGWVREEAEAKSRQVIEAYEILINPSKRKEYDEALKQFRNEASAPKSEAILQLSPRVVRFDDVEVDTVTRKSLIAFSNSGSAILNGTIKVDDSSVLRVTPNYFPGNSGNIEVVLDASNLEWGTVYSRNVIVEYNGTDSPLKIPVQIKVRPRKVIEKAQLRCDTTAVNFVDVQRNGIVNNVVKYYRVGSQPLVGSVTTDAPELLKVTPASLSADSGQIELALESSKLSPSELTKRINLFIAYNGADSPITIPVNIIVARQPDPPPTRYFGLLIAFAALTVGVWLVVQSPWSVPPPPPPPPPVIEHVLAKAETTSLNVRAEPFPNSTVLQMVNLHKGQALELLDTQPEWYKVRVNATGKRVVEGWINRRFLVKKDHLLKQVTSELAARGYGHVSADFDQVASKMILSGEVNNTTDSDKISRFLSRMEGIGNIDAANLRIASPNSTAGSNSTEEPSPPASIGRERARSPEEAVLRIRNQLAATNLEGLVNVTQNEADRITITTERGFSFAEAEKILQIIKTEMSQNPGLVFEVSCSIVRRAGQDRRFFGC
jgi:hypothetical protein